MSEKEQIINEQVLSAFRVLYPLRKCGFQDIFYAPGSRSAPLVMAMSAISGFRKHIHYDERGLGWYALGAARATKKPTVIFTTSGSAVANLYPAVVAACRYDIPLLIITADRPDELLDCGANQTTCQGRIFGKFASFLQIYEDYLDQTNNFTVERVCNIIRTCSLTCKPAHINIPFREPFYTADEEFRNSVDFSRMLEMIKEEAEDETEMIHGYFPSRSDEDFAESYLPVRFNAGRAPFHTVIGSTDEVKELADAIPSMTETNCMYRQINAVTRSVFYEHLRVDQHGHTIYDLVEQDIDENSPKLTYIIQSYGCLKSSCNAGLVAIACGAGLKSNILLIIDPIDLIADLNSVPLMKESRVKMLLLDRKMMDRSGRSNCAPDFSIEEIARGMNIPYRTVSKAQEFKKLQESLNKMKKVWEPEIIEITDIVW